MGTGGPEMLPSVWFCVVASRPFFFQTLSGPEFHCLKNEKLGPSLVPKASQSLGQACSKYSSGGSPRLRVLSGSLCWGPESLLS